MSPSTPVARIARHHSATLLALLLPLAGMVRAEPAPAANVTVPVPIISTDTTVRESLVNLDKFLVSNPAFEETLLANLDQAEQTAFREKNPAWDAQLKQQPATVAALKTERRFFVHRAIVRMAHAKVLKPEVVAFDAFLDTHPDVLAALEKKPRLIVDSDFMVAHPALADYFGKHPALSTALLENAEKRKAAGKTGAKN